MLKIKEWTLVIKRWTKVIKTWGLNMFNCILNSVLILEFHFKINKTILIWQLLILNIQILFNNVLFLFIEAQFHNKYGKIDMSFLQLKKLKALLNKITSISNAFVPKIETLFCLY